MSHKFLEYPIRKPISSGSANPATTDHPFLIQLILRSSVQIFQAPQRRSLLWHLVRAVLPLLSTLDSPSAARDYSQKSSGI